MAVFIQKQSGGNTVEVARAVRAEMENINKNLLADVNTRIVMDNSDFILASVYNLRNTLLFGAVFVVLVILFFLQNVRGCFIIAVSIPTSLIITFLLMWLLVAVLTESILVRVRLISTTSKSLEQSLSAGHRQLTSTATASSVGVILK
jgi:multidrug efflux pump subunit AcrB